MAFGDSLLKQSPQVVKSNKRIALFIDGANAWAAARNLDFEMDWEKVWDYFDKRYDLIRAYYYTAIPEGDAPLRPMVDWLHYNKFHLTTKATKSFVDASGRTKLKGNMDLEMAFDAFDIAPLCSDIFFFTGDGDFRIAVERIQRTGCRVHVISSIEVSPPMIADELRRQADSFLELRELIPHFRRKERNAA